MNGIMYKYILEQPDALTRVFEHRKEDAQGFIKLFREKAPKRIYLIGSGSSLNAAKAVAPVMEDLLDVEVTPVASSMLPKVRDKNAFIFFISQGGNSANTVSAIHAYEGYPHLAVTGTESCVVNTISEYVLIRCGEEKAGPKTKGYLSTYFVLYCIALECAAEVGRITEDTYRDRLAAIEKELGALRENIAVVDTWVKTKAEQLKHLEKMVCIGKGIGGAAALECALKLQETMLIPASGYEYEEFLHGPDMSIDEKMGGLYLLPDKSDPDYERFEGLIRYHRKKSPYVYTVCGDGRFNTDNDICIGSDTPTELRLLNWSLPAQMIASEITLMLGKEGMGGLIFKELDGELKIKEKFKGQGGD